MWICPLDFAVKEQITQLEFGSVLLAASPLLQLLYTRVGTQIRVSVSVLKYSQEVESILIDTRYDPDDGNDAQCESDEEEGTS